MNAHVARAQLLLSRSRVELAMQELRAALAEDPDDALAHGLLALCLAEQGEGTEALGEARTAVGLAPHVPWCFQTLARVLLEGKELQEADRALDEALRLDPEDAETYALRAGLRMRQERWEEALAAADQGLACDAEHSQCANLRALALVRLGRKDEAEETIRGALSRDPDNPLSHANQGWTALHQGNADRAVEHFREALRLDPGQEWAQAGIVEALKARNVIYRLLLRYFLLLGRLSVKWQWGILLGGFLLYRVALDLARSFPVLWVLVIAYILFAALTIFGVPLWNLALRLHPLGRHALSPHQRLGANLLALDLGLGLLALLGAWLTGLQLFWLIGMGLFWYAIPVAVAYLPSPGRAHRIMRTILVALGLVGLLTLGGIALLVLDPTLEGQLLRPVRAGAQVFVWGSVLSIWVGNIVSSMGSS